MTLARLIHNVHFAAAVPGWPLCLDRTPAAQSMPHKRPALQAPPRDVPQPTRRTGAGFAYGSM